MNKFSENLAYEEYLSGLTQGEEIMRQKVLKSIQKEGCFFQLNNKKPLLCKDSIIKLIKNL